MSIPITSPFNYLGVFLFIAGAFLVLSGLKIIQVEKITVQAGRTTLILGIISVMLGVIFLVIGQGKPDTATVQRTPDSTALAGIPVAGQGSPAVAKTPEPTFTNAAPATAGATPVTAATGTPWVSNVNYLATIQVMPLTITDNFSDNHNDWLVGEYNTDFADSTRTLSDGAFQIDITSKQQNITNRTMNFRLNDFWLSVEASVIDTSAAPEDVGLALTYRDDKASNYYELIFTMDGYYHVAVSTDQGGYEEVVKWTKRPEIQIVKGSPVLLGVLAHGNEYTFFFNGQAVGSMHDTTLQGPGAIGLGASLFTHTGNHAKVSFDNLEIREMR